MGNVGTFVTLWIRGRIGIDDLWLPIVDKKNIKYWTPVKSATPFHLVKI